MRNTLLLLVASAMLAASGCDLSCYPQGTVATYDLSDAFSGNVMAPASLGLPTTVPKDGGINFGTGVAGDRDCPATATCLMTTASTCGATCFGFTVVDPVPPNGGPNSDALEVSFDGFDPRLAETLTLPSPDVTASAWLSADRGAEGSGVTVTVTGGSFSSRVAPNEMDVTFSLTMVTSAGDHIAITNGKDVVHGQDGTRCYQD